MFLSYSARRGPDVDRLEAALRARGVPTWRDRRDLGFAPTPDQLEAAIDHADTAGAVLFVSREVTSSDYVLSLEAPKIFGRALRDPRFLVVPLLCDNLTFEEADHIFDGKIGLPRLRSWNSARSSTATLSDRDAGAIAGLILRQRMTAIDAVLPSGEPMQVRVDTRGSVGSDPALSLWVDLTRHFESRLCNQETWSDIIMPALQDVREAVSVAAKGRDVLLSGKAALPVGLALGALFSTTGGIDARWLQPTAGRVDEEWGLAGERERIDLILRHSTGDPGGRDIAMLLSVVDDVGASFAAVRPHLPRLRTVAEVSVVGFPMLNQSTARSIADATLDALREARRRQGVAGTVHVFGAMPLGLAMLVGRRLNTFGYIQTYEFISGDEQGYRPSIRFHADS